MVEPLVSVVVPAYQAASHIRETLDSVYAQTYQNFEIMLVNDGSPDTSDLEQAIRGYDERLIYIKQENQGPSGARNTGIRAAQGKYIACLDSDDVYLPEHLARLVSLLEEKGLDLAYSDSYITESGLRRGRYFEREPQNPPITFEKLLNEECNVACSATVASRQAMIDAGLFDLRFWRCEDFDLWLRMSFRGAKMGLVDQVGVDYRPAPDGLAADRHLLKLGRIEVYKKMLTLPLSPKQAELVEALIARTEGLSQMDLVKRYILAGRNADARKAAGKAAALLRGPRNWGVALVVWIAPWAFRWFLRTRNTRFAPRGGEPGISLVTREQTKNGNVRLQSKEMGTKHS